MSSAKQIKNKVVKVAFRAYFSTALSSGAQTVPIQPATFGGVASIADAYALYRVVKLSYRLHPGSAITATQCAAYIPGVTDNAPANVASCGAVLTATPLGYRATVPSEWVRLGSAELQSYMPWLKTIVGSPDSAEEVQGNIFVTGNASEVYQMEVCGVFEFKDFITNSMTPEFRFARASEQLLRSKQLKSSSSSKTGGGPSAVAI